MNGFMPSDLQQRNLFLPESATIPCKTFPIELYNSILLFSVIFTNHSNKLLKLNHIINHFK